MQYCGYIFGLFSVMLISVAASDKAETNSNGAYREDVDYDNLIDKRQGVYGNNVPYTNQHNVNPYQYDYKGYQNQYYDDLSAKDYGSPDNKEGAEAAFTSEGLDRQDVFGDDAITFFGVGIAVGAAVASAIALIQNSQQTSTEDFDALKARVTSLETDQTSICTVVKSVATASDGKTVDLVVNDGSTNEAGFIQALSQVSSPTCS